MRLILCLSLLVFFGPAPAQTFRPDTVDLELLLMADATGSIDDDEIRFQRLGYAEALTDPEVLDAISRGALGVIAVAYVEWASQDQQDIVVDWTLIDGAAAAEDFARRLIVAPRRAYGRNAIGAALMTGVALIEGNDHHAFRRVIDFSADSANNWNGPSIEAGRQMALDAGITINGLAVLCRNCPSGRPISYDLEDAFANRIIGGPGAFVVTADGDAAFSSAVRRKLILEVSGAEPRRDHAVLDDWGSDAGITGRSAGWGQTFQNTNTHQSTAMPTPPQSGVPITPSQASRM